jgi:hypothetical protein
MITKQKINNFQEFFFNIFIVVSYILIFISAIGISSQAPKYLTILDYYVRIYVCLFLIWRFNPFSQNNEFTSLDKKIAFNAGLVVLSTTVLSKYLNNIKQFHI